MVASAPSDSQSLSRRQKEPRTQTHAPNTAIHLVARWEDATNPPDGSLYCARLRPYTPGLVHWPKTGDEAMEQGGTRRNG